MEGISFPQNGVVSQSQPSACTMCGHLKQRLDFIENYLLVKQPEFAQLRRYVSTVTSGSEPFGYDSVSEQTTTYASISLTPNLPGSTQPIYQTYLGSEGGSSCNNSNISSNMQTSVGHGLPIENTKTKRKQTQAMAKQKPPNSSPITLKRRGRKRKYPIVTPDANQAQINNVQNLQQVHPPGPNGVMKIVIPAHPGTAYTVANAARSVKNQNPATKPSISQSQSGEATTPSMSSLDVLAAVSYLLKNGIGNVSSVGTETLSAPVQPRYLDQDQFKYRKCQDNDSHPLSQYNELSNQTYNNQHNIQEVNVEAPAAQELGPSIPGQQHPQLPHLNSNSTSTENQFHGNIIGQRESSPRSAHIIPVPDSHDEYNAIVTKAPAKEIIV